MKRIHIQKALTLSLLFSSALFADIHDRIEYKLSRVLRDVEVIIAGNTGNCTPITQGDINLGGGVYTITHSGEYCVTEDVEGTIAIDANCVSINLESHTVSADGGASAFTATGHSGIRIFNGCISDASDAGVLFIGCSALELSQLHMHDHDNDAIRAEGCNELYVHNVDFIGGISVRALGLESCASSVVENCEMRNFTSSGNGILEIISSNTVMVQSVDVSGIAFTGLTPAGAIHVVSSTDVVIEHSHANRTISLNSAGHGILIDTCLDSKVIGSQMHGNDDSGVELVGDNTSIALIECVAMENDFGFDFAQTSTATCCLVQDCRALSNTVIGFAHLTGPLTTTFIGNEAQCNGQIDYLINGGEINLQALSWFDGSIFDLNGGAALGARFTNITAGVFLP